jgi:hypothetical protein
VLVAIGGTQLNRIDVAENRPYVWHKREANYFPTRTPLRLSSTQSREVPGATDSAQRAFVGPSRPPYPAPPPSPTPRSSIDLRVMRSAGPDSRTSVVAVARSNEATRSTLITKEKKRSVARNGVWSAAHVMRRSGCSEASLAALDPHDQEMVCVPGRCVTPRSGWLCDRS